MKVWITKYALTEGIRELDVVEDGNGMVHAGINPPFYFHEGDFYPTKDEAIAAANIMREKKIANLLKQIEKLKQKTFYVIGAKS